MAEIEEWRRLRWDGSNAGQLDAFTVGGFRVVDPCDRIEDPGITGEVWDKLRSTWVSVRTGQFVVCGVLGEFYVLDEEVRAGDCDAAEAKAAAYESGITWGTSCLSRSAVLDSCLAETFRREGAEGKLAEAVLMLGAIGELAESWTADDGHGLPTPEMVTEADCGRAVLDLIAAGGPRNGPNPGDGEHKEADGDEPLTHFFHCWRFPDHHRCAVALIERQSEENDRLLVRAATAERAARDEQAPQGRKPGEDENARPPRSTTEGNQSP